MVRSKNVDAMTDKGCVVERTLQNMRSHCDNVKSIENFSKRMIYSSLFKKNQDSFGTIFLSKNQGFQRLFKDIEISTIELPKNYLITEEIVGLRKSLSTTISPISKNLKSHFQDLPPRLQDAVLTLAEQGWYVDFDMPITGIFELKELFLDRHESEAESELIVYFENRLEKIEEIISKQFHHRSHIVSSAFKAHKMDEYYLSIPVFLAQVDGICKDVVGQYFFSKKDRKPKTASYVEQIAADTFRSALLSPLAKTTSISASEQEREADFDLLNRHMVLHGESLDYGSQLNSLKAISLINYLTQVLKGSMNAQ